MTGVSSPQILWFTGQLKTLCASATRIHWVTLSTSRDGPIKAGPLKLVEIEGETSLIQVDPCVVALPNGGYRLYYTTTSDNCDPAYQTTEFHSAIWSSNHWKREPGRRLSGVGFVDPDVFRLPDGRWQMLFTHGFGHTIGSAVSTNGLDFTETAGQRIFGQVTATTPLANGYLTAYQSFGGRFGQGLLHVARSRDGVTFTKDPDFTWPEKPIQTESPSITLLTDKRFIMTYVTAKTLKAAPEHPTSERPAASPAH